MSLTRNTIFAVLMAVEQDLRRVCVADIPPEVNPLTPDETAIAQVRLRLDRGSEGASGDWRHLLDYIDLSQLLDTVTRNAEAIALSRGQEEKSLRDLVKELRKLTAVRNRVCHARPLEPDDLIVTLDASDLLLAPGLPITFGEVAEIRRELSETGMFPLTLTIPSFWSADLPVIDNNLPPPEFDDTGFIGRSRDRENLVKHLAGPHPLVTVTGEGGVGKTALTVRCLYDIRDQRGLYDAIVWTTLKVNRLTPSGVRSIVGAMSSEVDILSSVAARFGPVQAEASLEILFPLVTEILNSMSVLLVIDNLETLDRGAFRPLFEAIPRRSKIVLTSRIGIGELELRYPLQPMESQDSVRLLRTTARLFNATDLSRRDPKQLEDIAEKLFHSPLAIRWFVQSYSQGRSVRDLLDRRRSFDDLLSFCFQNLYETLDDQGALLLRLLVALGRPLSEVQLAILSGDRDIESIRTALEYLYASNLVMRSRDEWGDGQAALWTTSDFARQYITARDKQLASERGRVAPIFKALITARDTSRTAATGNAFQNRVIAVRTTDEAMVVRSLSEALIASNHGLHKVALDHVRTAEKLLPDFFEVWRVSAQVKDLAGDAIGAAQDFETAVDLADGANLPLLVFYAQFLRRQDSFDRAVQVLEAAATKSEAPLPVVATHAWMLTLSGNPKEAAAIFERVHEDVFELSSPGRSQFITQYAASLRRAADQEHRRGFSKEPMEYLCRALAVVIEAVRNGMLDEHLVEEARDVCRDAAFVLGDRCDMTHWRMFQPLAAELAPVFDLTGDDPRGPVRLAERCPAIAETQEFRSLFPLAMVTSQVSGADELVEGTLTSLGYGRDYGFVKGDSGEDFFLHRGHWRSGEWDELRRMTTPKVAFKPGPPRNDGKLRLALFAGLAPSHATRSQPQ